MNNRILLLGANGMLGGSIFRHFMKNIDVEIFGTVRSITDHHPLIQQNLKFIRTGIDVSDTKNLAHLIQELQPNIVINCVGLIKQLQQKHIPSIELNSLFPHQLAHICDCYHTKLIHFSTDCVFSGEKGMYKENDIPDASDLYGRSKLLGEVDYGKHLTLRTSIIGHELGNRGVSLIDWFLNQKESVKGFSNVIFSGLPTVFLAELLEKYIITDPLLFGIYHLSVKPIDKYSLLKLVKKSYGLTTHISKCDRLIIDRSLNSQKIRQRLKFIPPTWPILISKMHNEYQKYFV